MELTSELLELALMRAEEDEGRGWFFEQERWAELIFLLLHEVVPGDPERLRESVALLHDLGLLADSSIKNPDALATIRFVMSQVFPTRTDADSAVACVTSALAAASTSKPSRPLLVLRRHAEAARDEIAQMLSDMPMDEAQTSRAITYWLHAGFALPLSVESDVISDYCAARNITNAEFWAAADEAGVSFALAETVLPLDEELTDATQEE